MVFKAAVTIFILISMGLSSSYAFDLSQTQVVNMPEILSELNLYKNPNPYSPSYKKAKELGRAREEVIKWYGQYSIDESVCGVKFLEGSKKQYKLKTFKSKSDAESMGFKITHYKACGACSTLKDLSIYLSTPDLTTPARDCARKLRFKKAMKCFREKIGFTKQCAKAWSYNAQHTRKHCKMICVKEYGLVNILSGNFQGAKNNGADGGLNPCVACDELQSGAGFKYAAGRTRRNSGITSAIERTAEETFEVDHSTYIFD